MMKELEKNARNKWKNFCLANNIDNSLTPLEKLTRSIQIGKKSNLIKVFRKQFPIVPSFAITIHKKSR